MVFLNHSALWNDIQSKGILSYQQISSIHFQSNYSSPSNTNQFFSQSPSSNNVKRKLFQNSSTNQSQNQLSIIRSRSDPIVENSVRNIPKSSPYTMFYRKLYDLIISRINLLCSRLYGNQSNQFEKIVWNLFLYLFENFTELLFRSRDLDQILLSSIYYSANSNLFQKDQNEEHLTWFRLFQVYKSMPNAKLKTLRSVFIRQIDQNDLINHQTNSTKDPCLTPSKPAGTIHIIDGNMFGDIASFYSEIFLNIPNLEKNLQIYFKEDKLIDFPIKSKLNNEHISIHLGENISIDYSNKKVSSNLFSSSNEQINSSINQIKTNCSPNILSSSIEAGLNNTVQTTRIRTDDGKFLTTISTLSKLNHFNQNNSNFIINQNQNTILFGQSIKRTLSDDSNSNSNCLNSLTKKILQIENDRQNIQ